MTSSPALRPLSLEHCRFAVVDVETTGGRGGAQNGGRILEVAVVFGVDNPARHRAFGDALATAYVLRALLARARERGVETLEQLIEVHDRPRHQRMRNAECGMRNASAEVPARANAHCNSAFRIPHSALGE